MKKTSVVILGAGYGGVLAALNLLKKHNSSELDLTIVNKHNYHYLTTELHQPAAGTFSIDNTKIELSEIFKSKSINIIQSEVISISALEKKVILKDQNLSYDYLIVSLGAQAETFNIPGLKEYSFNKWTANGATVLNKHIESCIESYSQNKNDDNLTFVVGGGGFTGVEFACELSEGLQKLCAKYKVDFNKIRITLVESHNTVLSTFDPVLSELATNHLISKNIELHTDTTVVKCTNDKVYLKDGTIIPTKTLIWAAGVRGNSVLENSNFSCQRGRIEVNNYLEVPEYKDIFVIGDCAIYKNETTGFPYPPTAQIAIQMGQFVAQHITNLINKTKVQSPFIPSIKGTVASLGRNDAVGLIFNKRIKGKLAVFMKKVIDIRYLWIIGKFKFLKKARL